MGFKPILIIKLGRAGYFIIESKKSRMNCIIRLFDLAFIPKVSNKLPSQPPPKREYH